MHAQLWTGKSKTQSFLALICKVISVVYDYKLALLSKLHRLGHKLPPLLKSIHRIYYFYPSFSSFLLFVGNNRTLTLKNERRRLIAFVFQLKLRIIKWYALPFSEKKYYMNMFILKQNWDGEESWHSKRYVWFCCLHPWTDIQGAVTTINHIYFMI